MDKFIKILRVILVLFFVVWIVSWASIRAFKKKDVKEHSFINNALIELYNEPYKIKRYFEKIRGKNPFLALYVDNAADLYKIGEMSDLNEVNDSLYLLHYVYNDNEPGKVLLQNVKSGNIALEWNIPLSVIMDEIYYIDKEIDEKINLNYNGEIKKEKIHYLLVSNRDEIIITQPTLTNDSSLVFNSRLLNRIYKLNKESKIIWKSDNLAHHSVEIDEIGNIWAPSVDFNNKTSIKYKYRDDAILCLDKEGNEIYHKSLTELFKENHLFKSLIEGTPIYTNDGDDPFHLNDVQPVKTNTSFWKKGDVFLSIRNKSILALLRPSTNKILWIKQGNWNMQHDINIKNDSVISIFNNNRSFLNYKINTSSNVVNYNFNNDKQQIVFKDIFKTQTEGRQTILKNGDFLIEATNTGIYYLLDNLGQEKVKFYVPYPPNPEFAHYPGWSRVYIKENNRFIEQ